jgi:CRISPR type III-B/RAMP module RAMP protein Cmr6
VITAAGPIGSLIELRKRDGRDEPWRLAGKAELGTGSSPLVLLNRVAFFDAARGKLHESGKQELVRWACDHQLGQDAGLISHVVARREAALRALSARRHVVRLLAEPEWRIAAGLGSTANAHEISLALHGTYGWPVLPGSALKGLAAAWAVASGTAEADDIGRVLGTPRLDVATGQDAARGTVCFLDGIPAGEPVAVEPDVLTPHVKPYYDGIAAGKPVPPAEYHNPVPVIFLTVRGSFFVDLHGDSRGDTEKAADWLIEAGDDLGVGAKTAAGYGYLRVERREKALA